VSDAEDEITAAEAAVILGVDRSVVLKRVKAGELRTSRKLPGRTGAYLFRRKDIADRVKAA
jgi:hypothetical protein